MDLKKSSITADILNVLTDCKVHTIDEIAFKVEVSRSTVKRHIQSLSYRYPIQTFRGGINRGGVCLDKDYIHQGKVLTNDELQVINKALTLLQKCGSEDVNPELIANLLSRFSQPQQEEQDNGERKLG
ncbi:MAG: HTH domain-containing protein [Clostridia bacterium]|nr:HTH domain-containing protein [Clostridia bacterium]MBR1984855.1 HTH domain-containing protein [Clostridia bacterium]